MLIVVKLNLFFIFNIGNKKNSGEMESKSSSNLDQPPTNLDPIDAILIMLTEIGNVMATVRIC